MLNVVFISPFESRFQGIGVCFFVKDDKMESNKQIKIGVGLYIFDDKNRVLLGLRKSLHGKGTWCPPGGHLEYGESFEEAAKRETKEETGIEVEIKDIVTEGVTNDFFKETGKHYITVHLSVKSFRGIAQVIEPEKCAEWRWFEVNKLPENLFLPVEHFLHFHNK